MIEFQTQKIKRSSVTLVPEKKLENSRKGSEIIHIEVECGRETIARHALVEILAKCQHECPEEQEEVEESKLMRESRGKYSRKRIL